MVSELLLLFNFFIVFNAYSATTQCSAFYKNRPLPIQVLVHDEHSDSYRLAEVIGTPGLPSAAGAKAHLWVRYSDGSVDSNIPLSKTIQIDPLAEKRRTIVNLSKGNNSFALSKGEIIGQIETSKVDTWESRGRFAIKLETGDIYLFDENQLFQTTATQRQFVVNGSAESLYSGGPKQTRDISIGTIVGEKIVSSVDTNKNFLVVELKNGSLQVVKEVDLFVMEGSIIGRTVKIPQSIQGLPPVTGKIIGYRQYRSQLPEFAIELENHKIILKYSMDFNYSD